jgi:MFS family permease
MTMKTLLRRGDVRLLLAGQALSMFGDWMMIIVLAIWTKVLTGSNGAAGLVFFTFAIASLLAPLGGLVVDRVRKRPLMIGTHLALAGVMCLLLLVHDRSDLWLLYVVTALYGLGGDLFAAARGSMQKAMLPDELLAEANGALQSLREGMRIFAPLAGAGLYAAAGGSVVALVDAGTFVASAATLVALRFAEPLPAPREAHVLREASAGLTHIWRVLALRQLTIGVSMTLLLIGFSETLIFAVTAAIHHAPSFIGVLETFQGVGAIVGGITAPKLLRRFGDVRLAGIGVAGFAVADLLWIVPSTPLVLAACAVAGVGLVWAIVAIATAYQKRSPQALQGRVAAASNMIFSVPQTISIATGAVLITLVDFRVEILAMFAGVALSSVYLLTRNFSRSSRFTTFGSAFPFVSRITAPTKKPSTPSLPPR